MAALKSCDGAANSHNKTIEFIDLKTQQNLIRSQVDAAISRVLSHGQYIMGPEVVELEQQLAAFTGAKHAISCSSGTDAILMGLMAAGVGPGDAVICPAFTYTATPEVVVLIGATPVFADVDNTTFNLDPEQLTAAIETARRRGLKPKVLMAVDLFGQPADYDQLLPIAAEHGLMVLCDSAQSFGATHRSRKVGQIGHVTATSFFPAKPLGCYGDGGAIFTDDDELAEVMRSIRAHGKGAEKYDVARIGINGRLDTLQAAILIEKMKLFPDEVAARDRVAQRYNAMLSDVITVPHVLDGCQSVWAQYTLRFADGDRDQMAAQLKRDGIPTAVYYPRPLNHQPAYAECPVAHTGVAVSERLAGEVLSLPMHPYLDNETQDVIVAAVKRAIADRSH